MGRLWAVVALVAPVLVPALVVPAAAVPAAAAPSGGSTVSADFDGNGYGDLAVGEPSEDIGALENAGGVNVIYGAQNGLRSQDNQFWQQDGNRVAGAAQEFDDFGSALAAGDFDNDGFDDLAIGVPGQTVDGAAAAGAVHVFYGSRAGLTADRNHVFRQGADGLGGVPEMFDFFGIALVAANFGNGAREDLAVGIMGQSVGGRPAAGAVQVVYGANGGLAGAGNQTWHQDRDGVTGTAGPGERFGSALAAGEFGNGPRADLAAGIPGDSVGAVPEAGSVQVLFGGDNGISAAGGQLWSQDSPGIAGASEEGDEFGASLAAANFGNGDTADLAIGAPSENIGAVSAAGAVNVLYSTAAGFTAANDQLWYQGDGQLGGSADPEDHFGGGLAAADFGSGPEADLAVGASGEDWALVPNAGLVQLVYGSAAGLAAPGNEALYQNDLLGFGNNEPGDSFGRSITAANFGNGARADLAAAAPGESLAAPEAGAVVVAYGSDGGPDPATAELWSQDSPDIRDQAEAYDHFGSAVPGASAGT